MPAELFLDSAGIASTSGVSIATVEPTDLGVVLDTQAEPAHDYQRVFWGSMYHDEDGTLGTAGRLHYWYNFRQGVTNLSYPWAGTAYAYSDDGGDTWTRPSLGLHSFNGSTDNNIVQLDPVGAPLVMIVGVGVVPTDAKPFKFLVHGEEEGYLLTLRESASPYLTDSTIVRSSLIYQDHPSFTVFPDGTYAIGIQGWYPTFPAAGGDTDRMFGIDFMSDPANDPQRIAFTDGVMQDGGSNVVTLNAATNEQHGGDILGAVTDLWGDIAVLSPQKHTRDRAAEFAATRYQQGYWEADLVTCRSYADGIVANADFTNLGALVTKGAIRAFDPPESANFSALGDYDGGCVSIVSGSWIRGATEDTAFVTAWLPDYTVHSNNPAGGGDYDTTDHDRFVLSKRTWRKDGLTRVEGTGSFITEPIDFTGKVLFANYNGGIKCEVLDATTQEVMPGYSQADCDLLNTDTIKARATWNGLDVPQQSVRLKWYINSELYAYYVETPQAPALTLPMTALVAEEEPPPEPLTAPALTLPMTALVAEEEQSEARYLPAGRMSVTTTPGGKMSARSPAGGSMRVNG